MSIIKPLIDRKYICIAVIPFLLFPFYCLAQHHIGIGLGAYITNMSDEVVSPLIYNGENIGGNVLYSFRGERNIHTVDIDFSMGKIYSSISDKVYLYKSRNELTGEIEEDFIERDEFQILSSLYYSYYRLLFSEQRFSLYLGGLLDYDFHMWFSNFPVATTILSLNPGLKIEYYFDKNNNLSFEAFSPILTHLNRPPWTAADDEIMELAAENPMLIALRGHLTSVHEYFKIATRLTYRYSLLEFLDGAVIWDFGFSYTPVPQPKKAVQNNISLGIIFKI